MPKEQIVREPGDWGAVQIDVTEHEPKQIARSALLMLAYSVHDPVARASVKGLDWASLTDPDQPREFQNHK